MRIDCYVVHKGEGLYYWEVTGHKDLKHAKTFKTGIAKGSLAAWSRARKVQKKIKQEGRKEE